MKFFNNFFDILIYLILNFFFRQVTSLRTMKKITQDDLIIDPLQVLRCDRRVFSCAPILEIILYILKACIGKFFFVYILLYWLFVYILYQLFVYFLKSFHDFLVFNQSIVYFLKYECCLYIDQLFVDIFETYSVCLLYFPYLFTFQ